MTLCFTSALQSDLKIFSMLVRQNKAIKYGFFINGNTGNFAFISIIFLEVNFACMDFMSSELRRRILPDDGQTISGRCTYQIWDLRDTEWEMEAQVASENKPKSATSQVRRKRRLEAAQIQ